MNDQTCLFDDNAEYNAFVDKFKPKKTTDDCYTPPLVYDAVRDWACTEYRIDPCRIVRPFYPGGDYENYEYPDGCVVLDNPPFSILTKICEFYLDRNIPFFLFAPTLTLFSRRNTMRMNHIISSVPIVYENGANVPTSYVTSFGGDVLARTAPELDHAVKNACEKVKKEVKGERPKYIYPDHILTSAMMQRYAKRGVDFSVRRESCMFVDALDSQKECGKRIYGYGLLLSEKAAAEKAAAEKADTIIWQLSSREREIVKALR